MSRAWFGVLVAALLASSTGCGAAVPTSPLTTVRRTDPVIENTASVETLEIELHPTDSSLLQQCQDAANLLGFPVPCPSALPPTNQPVRCRTPSEFAAAVVTPKEGCALGRAFILVPDGFTNHEVHHFVLEASKTGRDDCGEGDPQYPVPVKGTTGAVLDCSEFAGLLSDHVLLRFELEGVVIEVSVHDRTEYNRRLVVAVAETIEMIEPD